MEEYLTPAATAHLSQHPEGLPPPLQHPAIGQIQGRYNKGVVQYLGLKYAVLRHRLADPEVTEYSGLAQLDATKYGPPVVTPDGSADQEMAFIQEHLPKFDVPPMSDLHGLNLNVTVPQDCGSNLPVVVYIHGGGFNFGSSSNPPYDQSKIVELSAIMDQPIVAINLNYRLGIPGFLFSKELCAAGIKANRGLRDQRAALIWVKKYISGFGGDPENITVLGQSAGAASVNFLMHSTEPLFQQAMLLGGTFLMMRPATEKAADSAYEGIMRTLGISGLSPSERLEALLGMPKEKLVEEITPELVSLGPVVDHDFIPMRATFGNLGDELEFPIPGKKWCHRLFSVDSQFDGSIFGLVNLNARKNGIASAFQASLERSLGREEAGKVQTFYNIAADTSDPQALDSIIQFVTDISFYAPAVRMAESWPGLSYVGHFNERNPFEGPYKGRASHMLDVAYIWGNYNRKYTKQNWITARAFAEDFVSFVTGRDQLPVFNRKNEGTETSRPVTVYGPSEQNISSKVVELGSLPTGRNHGIFTLAADVGGLDVLLDAMSAFLSGQ